MDKETSAQMMPIFIVIYAAYAVFIATATILVLRTFASQCAPMVMSDVTVVSVDMFKDISTRTCSFRGYWRFVGWQAR